MLSLNFFWTCFFHFDFCWYSQARPNVGCFSHRWLLLGATKLAPKISFLQHKFYSLKAHAHYFTFLIYFQQLEELLKLVFLLVLHPSTYLDVVKVSQLTNVCILIQIPSCFLWALDHSIAHVIAWLYFFIQVPPPPKICITSWFHPFWYCPLRKQGRGAGGVLLNGKIF